MTTSCLERDQLILVLALSVQARQHTPPADPTPQETPDPVAVRLLLVEHCLRHGC
jgi:hypothetical protein